MLDRRGSRRIVVSGSLQIAGVAARQHDCQDKGRERKNGPHDGLL
jgi:hypothetical protein